METIKYLLEHSLNAKLQL